MSGAEFLAFVRGPLLGWAVAIFVFGMVLRLFEIFMLGRRKTLAERRGSGVGNGFVTIVMRSGTSASSMRSMFTLIAGYVFHIGFLVALFLLAPHIELFGSVLGFTWPALPTPVVDFFTVLAMVTLLMILWRRLTLPVLKHLSTKADYLVWLLTFLPLLTGYMSYHHLFFPYTWLLAFHILSVVLLLVLFPFTKLTHSVTLFFSRWYNGMMAGQKGVQS